MNFTAARLQMVERQLRARGIHDERVLAAMGSLPREQFVPENHRRWAYADEPLQIGHDQTISQPYITALMAQELALQGTERVLEVGSGSGYHAAVLGALARSVVTLELVEELATQARANLEAAGCAANVRVVHGDGSAGFQELAPYDAISVAAAAPAIPPELLAQLADGGRLVIPVGSFSEQTLTVLTRAGAEILCRTAGGCRFVPLLGEAGWA